MTYTVVVRSEPDGRYTALVPALPDVVGRGGTPDEAKRAAASVLRGRLADRASSGEAPPPDVEVSTLPPEAMDEEEYEALVDEGLAIVMAERVADPANEKGIPWEQVKEELGL